MDGVQTQLIALENDGKIVTKIVWARQASIVK